MRRSEVHTTLDEKDFSILERYQEKLGCDKKTVISMALNLLDRGKYIRKPKIDFMTENVWVKTGTPGLDEILGGGLRYGAVLNIHGKPATGKSSLALQYLLEGAENGEKVVLFCEESPRNVVERGYLLGKRMHDIIEEKDIEILSIDNNDFDDIVDTLFDTGKVNRVVIDPVDAVNGFYSKDMRARWLTLNRFKKYIFCLEEKRTACLISEEASEISNSNLQYTSDVVLRAYKEQQRDETIYMLNPEKNRSSFRPAKPQIMAYEPKKGISLVEAAVNEMDIISRP